MRFLECMVFHCLLCQTETQDLRPDFGRNYSQPWVLAKFKYSIPSVDRWTIREVDSSARRYASGMCNGIYGEWG